MDSFCVGFMFQRCTQWWANSLENFTDTMSCFVPAAANTTRGGGGSTFACYSTKLVKQFCEYSCGLDTCIMAHMKTVIDWSAFRYRALPIRGILLRWGPAVAPTVSGVTVLLCKVTHTEVQFCVRLSQQIRSHSPAVLLRCLKVFCQLDEPDKSTQPTDHHRSSGVAEFRHEYWTSTEPHSLRFTVLPERLRSVWRSGGLTVQTIFSYLLTHVDSSSKDTWLAE